jgi:hypothetical protein
VLLVGCTIGTQELIEEWKCNEGHRHKASARPTAILRMLSIASRNSHWVHPKVSVSRTVQNNYSASYTALRSLNKIIIRWAGLYRRLRLSNTQLLAVHSLCVQIFVVNLNLPANFPAFRKNSFQALDSNIFSICIIISLISYFFHNFISSILCVAFCCILVHSVAFCCILVHSVAFWWILLHSVAFWCILLHSVAFWYILLHSSAFYCIKLLEKKFPFV